MCTKRQFLFVVFGLLIGAIIVSVIIYAMQVKSVFSECLAKGHLRTINKSVEELFNETGELKDAGRALEVARFIESYYPLGVDIQPDDPVANEYQAKRVIAMNKIRAQFVKMCKTDYGFDWNRWEKCLRRNGYIRFFQ